TSPKPSGKSTHQLRDFTQREALCGISFLRTVCRTAVRQGAGPRKKPWDPRPHSSGNPGASTPSELRRLAPGRPGSGPDHGGRNWLGPGDRETLAGPSVSNVRLSYPPSFGNAWVMKPGTPQW